MVISYDYAREANDAYYEPAWCDERLFEFMNFPVGSKIWDPACGTGTIPKAAEKHGLKAFGSDKVQRWADGEPRRKVLDYLLSESPLAWHGIVSNPPFKLAQEFAVKAATEAPYVCLLLPATWIQGAKRSRWLMTSGLKWFLPLAPRPSMPPVGSDAKPQGGKVDYAWFVWEAGHFGDPQIRWIFK